MASREEWIGRVGLEWARRADALECLLAPPGDAGLAALAARPGIRVLDLGGGAGATAATLADAVGPAGHVTIVDVSPDLAARARERLAGRANITIIEADAATHPFEAEGFDALYARFGSMFFDDPPAAFANLRRALRPGAPAVFVSWRDLSRNLWAALPLRFAAEAMGQAGGPPVPVPGPGPFAWADPDVFHAALGAGGFREVTQSGFDFSAALAEGDHADPLQRAVSFMMRIGPLASRLRGASDDVKAAARAFLEEKLAPYLTDGAIRLPASAWIIRAQA